MTKRKVMATLLSVLVLISFAMMAAASGSSDSSNKKEIAGAEGGKDNPEEEKKDVTIEEQVLVDQDGIKITAKSYEKGTYGGDKIKLLIENTSDKDVDVRCDHMIINDYMINEYFHAQVNSGMKSNEDLLFSSTDMERSGVVNAGKIELVFSVSESGTYDKIIESDIVTIKTSLYDEADYSAKDDGYELYNDNGIRIVGKYVDEDSIWGTAVLLFIENKTDNEIIVTCDSLSVNGFMIDSYLYSDIFPGKMILDTMSLSSTDLKNNEIESVNDVTVSFSIRNADSITDKITTDPIEFSVNG